MEKITKRKILTIHYVLQIDILLDCSEECQAKVNFWPFTSFCRTWWELFTLFSCFRILWKITKWHGVGGRKDEKKWAEDGQSWDSFHIRIIFHQIVRYEKVFQLYLYPFSHYVIRLISDLLVNFHHRQWTRYIRTQKSEWYCCESSLDSK